MPPKRPRKLVVGQTTLALATKKDEAEGEGEQHATTPQKPSSPVKSDSTSVKAKRPQKPSSNQCGGARKRAKAVSGDKKETPVQERTSEVASEDDEECAAGDDESIEALLGMLVDSPPVTGVAGDARAGDPNLDQLAPDAALGVCSDMLAGKFDGQICVHIDNLPGSPGSQKLEDHLDDACGAPWSQKHLEHAHDIPCAQKQAGQKDPLELELSDWEPPPEFSGGSQIILRSPSLQWDPFQDTSISDCVFGGFAALPSFDAFTPVDDVSFVSVLHEDFLRTVYDDYYC